MLCCPPLSIILGGWAARRLSDALRAPWVSWAQQDGRPRQFTDPAAQGSEGPASQPADLQQAQTLPQEQQVSMSKTDPHPYLQSATMRQSREKTREETR